MAVGFLGLGLRLGVIECRVLTPGRSRSSRKHQRMSFRRTVWHLSNERLPGLIKRAPGPTWTVPRGVARAAASSMVRCRTSLIQPPIARGPAQELRIAPYYLATPLWGLCLTGVCVGHWIRARAAVTSGAWDRSQ